MKKIAILAAALFCSPLAMAQAPVVDAAVAESAQAMEIVDTMLGKMEEIVTALEAVNDTASADAAAAKITQIKAEIDAISAEMEALGELPPDVQEALESKLMEGLIAIAPRLEEVGNKLSSQNFYNSTALIQALNQE